MTSTSHTAPVVILLHGAGLNGASWNPVRRHIDPRIELFTPDLPGHGARLGERFTLQGAVDVVLAAVSTAGGRQVVVGGDSLGGYVSTACAAALPPEQLKGLILSGCSANFAGAAAMLPVMLKKLGSQLTTLLLNQRQIDHLLLGKLRGFGLGESDIAAIMAGGMNPGIFPHAVDALRGVDFRAKVAAVTEPILFVNGAKDAFCMRQQAAFIAAARAPQHHTMDNTDHGVSLLRSADFAALVNRFALPRFGLAAA
ncbi:MAG TPA: alpha/beta hydrolase [Telluria sp.]|jgi:pimeloyl-ACP methyl ester carboxylesterase